MVGRFRIAVATGVAALLACAGAFAQDPFSGTMNQNGTAPAITSPAVPGFQVPPVQTPTITNNEQRPEAQPLLERQRLQRLQSQRPQQQPAAQREAQPAARAENTSLPPVRNEFQEFIETSTGKRLPLFGFNLFEAPSTFAPVDNIPVTPDYVIGPGDELLVRAWGQIDVDYRATVDRNGSINIPRVGSVPVAGVQYRDLTNHVRTAVSKNFRNFEIQVTMGQLRSVQIFVVGHARRPGAYTVSSLSTLVNAVFAAGGPAGHGSMRQVQLKRGDKVVTEFDLYDLLLSGDKSKDVPLLPGDVIYFPPVGALAAVSGSVHSPAIFELKGQTTLGQLVNYAGGLATTAQERQATIERIDNRKARTVEQVTLDFTAAQRPVKDGDLISVLSIVPKFENAVTLRGNVATPLRYPHRPGMRVRDLIPDKDALITRDYYQRKNLAVRTDVVSQGTLVGDVRRLADEINWDYAVIERQNPADLTTSLIPFNLGKAVLENDPSQNLPLNPGDIVTVFSKNDVAAPSHRRSVVVRLEGEFNFAGVYQAKPGETLRQLVTRVGGVTPKAYLFGAEFTRESTRRDQELRIEQALNQLEQDVQRAAVNRAQNVVSPEDATALKTEAEAQRLLVQRLRTVRPTGRIVLEMPEDAKVADLPDMALEDGDRLYIPQQPSMVNVFGTVFNESSFLYAKSKGVGDYLAQAGGPRKEADKSSIYVLRADGSVVSRQQSGLLTGSLGGVRVMPGDTIVVPEDFQRTSWTKDLKDWTQIFYQFGLGAAALKVIKE